MYLTSDCHNFGWWMDWLDALSVSTSVYKRHQQFRIMGCVKHGDTRVLRLHPRTTKCDAQLVDTLICVPADYTAVSMPPQQQADPVLRCRPARVRCSTEWLPNLLLALSSKLTCGFYDIQLHARYGFDSPSVYLHTNRTTCSTTAPEQSCCCRGTV
jgi:hypothetical protein